MMSHKVLIIPGLNGSGPDHWQSVWEDERLDCARVDQRDWDDPDPIDWLCRIEAAVKTPPVPTLLVAHSLGCLAVAAWAAVSRIDRDSPMAAMLVAPCGPSQIGASPAIQRFSKIADHRLAMPSLLVASTNDPFASFARTCKFASVWGSQLVEAGELGHINAQSNLGAWHWGQALLDRMIAAIVAPPVVRPARGAFDDQRTCHTSSAPIAPFVAAALPSMNL
jgi:uncharacterized protein